MPLIVPYGETLPIAVLGGGSELEAFGSVAQQFRATLIGSSTIFANGELLMFGSATLVGSSDLYALGRLGDEPNVFGLADIGGSSAFEANGVLKIGGKAVLAGSSSLEAFAEIAQAEGAAFNIHVTVADQAGPGLGATYSARILADGVSYPIRAAQVQESDLNAGININVQLQRPSDRAAILAADEFSFDIYDNGVWKSIFDSGRRSAGSYSFAWATEGRPADGLSLSTVDAIAETLERSPDNNLTIYDAARETIDAEAFEKIYDENGVPYTHELIAIGGLTLHQLLDRVFVTILGFDSVFCTVSDYPIRRADFSITGSYLEGIAQFLGPFEPLIYVKNNVLFVLDSTIALPAGLEPAIPAVGHDEYRSAEFSVSEQTADGYIVQYVENDSLYDYTTTREVSNLGDPDTTGTEGNGNYTETVTARTYRDYFKSSNPSVPVNTVKIREVVTVRGMVGGVMDEISETTEVIEVDRKMRLLSIAKDRTALIPNVAASGFPTVRTTVDSELTLFDYRPDIRNPRREYMSRQTREKRGLVAIDAGNQHLDQDFKIEFFDAWRGGNLSGNVTTEYQDIESFTESVDVKRNGQIEVRSRTANFLTSPPSVHSEITEGRAGDITTNAVNTQTNQVIIYRTGITSRTGTKLQPFPIGEVPITIGRPLAKRRLDKRQRLTGSVTWKGLNLAYGIGSQFQLFDRDGDSVGFFIVEGREINMSNLGDRTQLTDQILQVREIATNGPALGLSDDQPSGLSGSAGDTIAFTLEIECSSGYEISADSDNADIRIWGKANPGDAFQNLHTTPIDLTPYAGDVRTFYFELRIDAGADDGDYSAAVLVGLP